MTQNQNHGELTQKPRAGLAWPGHTPKCVISLMLQVTRNTQGGNPEWSHSSDVFGPQKKCDQRLIKEWKKNIFGHKKVVVASHNNSHLGKCKNFPHSPSEPYLHSFLSHSWTICFQQQKSICEGRPEMSHLDVNYWWSTWHFPGSFPNGFNSIFIS